MKRWPVTFAAASRSTTRHGLEKAGYSAQQPYIYHATSITRHELNTPVGDQQERFDLSRSFLIAFLLRDFGLIGACRLDHLVHDWSGAGDRHIRAVACPHSKLPLMPRTLGSSVQSHAAADRPSNGTTLDLLGLPSTAPITASAQAISAALRSPANLAR